MNNNGRVNLRIRSATPDDLDWLLSQLKEFSKFFGTKRPLYGDENFVRSGMTEMMTKHLVLVAEKDMLGPVGFIAGIVTPHVYNPKIRLLVETFWWVTEEYRGGRAGLLLLDSFLDWGKKNADWITMSIESHGQISDRILLKRGFHLQERSYLLETNSVSTEV